MGAFAGKKGFLGPGSSHKGQCKQHLQPAPGPREVRVEPTGSCAGVLSYPHLRSVDGVGVLTISVLCPFPPMPGYSSGLTGRLPNTDSPPGGRGSASLPDLGNQQGLLPTLMQPPSGLRLLIRDAASWVPFPSSPLLTHTSSPHSCSRTRYRLPPVPSRPFWSVLMVVPPGSPAFPTSTWHCCGHGGGA